MKLTKQEALKVLEIAAKVVNASSDTAEIGLNFSGERLLVCRFEHSFQGSGVNVVFEIPKTDVEVLRPVCCTMIN